MDFASQAALAKLAASQIKQRLKYRGACPAEAHCASRIIAFKNRLQAIFYLQTPCC
jgi:hypothetical protein